ncbi:MAG: ABC transporter substrate-binding protein [Alphaproteobacteria bacterium]|nr:ABC transporter substrate-binding protein [Alphaproteobacteria bacterium]
MLRKLLWSLVLACALIGTNAEAARRDIVVGMTLEPPHLDPTAGAAAAIDEVVYQNVFEGLTRINERGEVLPSLAKRWEISSDGRIYKFHLRDGVSFHDGSPMSADDVVFSLDRARSKDSVNAQKVLFNGIVSAKAIDPVTVEVRLARPNGGFLFNMGWGDAVIVSQASADGNKANPVGTGPFKFVKWTKGDRVELARFDGYWGKPVKLDKATFKFVPDAAAQVAAMLAGDIDAYPNLGSPESLPPFQADPRFKVEVGTTEGETILAINNAKPPLDDIRVRRALAHAVDRDSLIKAAMFGFGTPIGSHFAPHHTAYVDLTGRYPHDPAKAKALLGELGFSPDNPLKLTLKLPPPTYARRGGEVLAAQLKAVGVEAELIPVPWAQWLDQVFKNKDYDLTIVSHTEPVDINIYGRGDYYFNYASDEVKALLLELDRTQDPGTRRSLFGKLQRQVAEDSVNAFLFQLPKMGVWNAKLRGLWTSSPVQANDLTKAHWVE